MRTDALVKREEIEQKERDAELMRSQPVDDSKIVEQMFGFLPEGEQGHSDEGQLSCSIELASKCNPLFSCQDHLSTLPSHTHTQL